MKVEVVEHIVLVSEQVEGGGVGVAPKGVLETDASTDGVLGLELQAELAFAMIPKIFRFDLSLSIRF